jgi:retron-type reverse transcriptase
MSIIVHKNYDELFSLDNIFAAWRKFRRGKAGKKDVMNFELHLEDNIFSLYEDLEKCNYKHSSYKHFQIFDNKKRDIYKAEVRDRVVHQIMYDYLLSLFEPEFISDSYSSRLGKGQYKAIGAFRYFIKLSESDGKQSFVLKCDIKKYFDSVDQKILIDLIEQKIICEKTRKIIREIICSYIFSNPGKGIPLGNITSQIFANIYLNSLDNYLKRELKCRFYVRYNDDFVIVSEFVKKLEEIRCKAIIFVKEKLLLEIPIEKTSIRKVAWGIDFLGFTILPKAILLRNKTKQKMYKNISLKNLHSYFGILKHCNSYNLRRKILSMEKPFKI